MTDPTDRAPLHDGMRELQDASTAAASPTAPGASLHFEFGSRRKPIEEARFFIATSGDNVDCRCVRGSRPRPIISPTCSNIPSTTATNVPHARQHSSQPECRAVVRALRRRRRLDPRRRDPRRSETLATHQARRSSRIRARSPNRPRHVPDLMGVHDCAGKSVRSATGHAPPAPEWKSRLSLDVCRSTTPIARATGGSRQRAVSRQKLRRGSARLIAPASAEWTARLAAASASRRRSDSGA